MVSKLSPYHKHSCGYQESYVKESQNFINVLHNEEEKIFFLAKKKKNAKANAKRAEIYSHLHDNLALHNNFHCLKQIIYW